MILTLLGHFQGREKKRRDFDDSSLFVSAEEFGHLLDENMGSKFDNIGMNAMANKDNASLNVFFKYIKMISWGERVENGSLTLHMSSK